MPYKDPNCAAAKESQRRRTIKYRSTAKGKAYIKKSNMVHSEYRANYCKTKPNHYKNRTIHNWKRRNIIDEDYDSLFEYYLNCNNCMICLNTFDKRINKHLDHNHETGEPRYILCRSCNIGLMGDNQMF